MIKTNGKETLSDKIATVLNTAPTTFDPEDGDLDHTGGHLVNIEPYDEDSDEEVVLSTFRKQNVDLLGDVYKKYSGVKTSRKELFDYDEQFESGKSYEEQEPSEDDEYVENDNEQNNLDEQEDSDETYSEIEENDTKGSEDDISEYEDDIKSNDAINDSTFKTFGDMDLSAQVKKGLSVRNQLSIWEDLLEMRIQLQKSVVIANKMPGKKDFNGIKQSGGKEFSSQLTLTKNSLIDVLDKLLLLQKLLLKKYPETRNLGKDREKDNIDEDEEIPSDTDEEQSVGSEEEANEKPPIKRRKVGEFEKDISDHYIKYQSYRNNVIQKWNEKTRIAVMKNSNQSHSVLSQIEYILSDKQKLIKRTQLKRSEYDILGQTTMEHEVLEEQHVQSKGPDEYNTEIFDDDDFYHQLLRELIEVKSADLTDPVQLSRQWIKLQDLRSKMKRKVDTKATKGRKIRYVVHPKLVNFMAPIDEELWTEQAKNDLCNSLFGKRQRPSIT